MTYLNAYHHCSIDVPNCSVETFVFISSIDIGKNYNLTTFGALQSISPFEDDSRYFSKLFSTAMCPLP